MSARRPAVLLFAKLRTRLWHLDKRTHLLDQEKSHIYIENSCGREVGCTLFPKQVIPRSTLECTIKRF